MVQALPKGVTVVFQRAGDTVIVPAVWVHTVSALNGRKGNYPGVGGGRGSVET